MRAGWLLAGVMLALWAPGAWQSLPLWLVMGSAAVLVAAGHWRPACFLAAGFLHALLCAQAVLHASWDCDQRRLVEARIASIAGATDGGWEFDAVLTAARPPDFPPLRTRLSLRGAAAPRAGERWLYLVQFAAPPATAAERRALLRDHVSARARVRDSPLNRRLQPAAASIDGLRERVAQRIAERVADPAAAALLVALAVGVTTDVTAMQWRVFNATGITHLVAISGMHVTFFALLCMAAARRIWHHWPWLALRCRRETFAAAAGVVLALGYALLSGFSVPAQRTAVMLAAFLLARLCARGTPPAWSMGMALIAVLAWDPLAVLSAGFWLSFCAVAAIIQISGGRQRPAGALRAAASVQWLVTVALLPLTVLLFGTFSAIGPLVNVLAIPLFTFALVPPLLVATALHLLPGALAQWMADALVSATAWLASAAWPVLARAADLSWALWPAQPSWVWLLLSAPATLLLLWPVPVPLRLVSAAALLGVFLIRAAPPPEAGLRVQVLDVGGSRAVLLATRHHRLLVGTGEAFGSAGRRFETRVLSQILRQGGGLDLWLLPALTRDVSAAVAMGHARLGIAETLGDASLLLPPEVQSCTTREWDWDGIRLALRNEQGRCWVQARSRSGAVVIAPERLGDGPLPTLDPDITLFVLPRRAGEALRLLDAVQVRHAIASVSASEWRSSGWAALRTAQAGRGGAVLSTAGWGSLKFELRPGEVRHVGAPPWQLGIWSAERLSEQCRAPAPDA